jgi:alpha,alpha-trehalase
MTPKVAGLAAAGWCALAALAPAGDELTPDRLAPVRKYIKDGWTTLTRSSKDLVNAAPDPKLHLPPGQPWPVYLAASEDRPRVEKELASALTPEQRALIELRVLPADPLSVKEHGLLYLPHPYVVPGGRFNEMYGWDSYFIQVGLLRDDEVGKARDLVDNFVYEIDRYGTILNANRTYFLSRSQPPFLTRMILGVYERTHDKDWLKGAWPAVEKYYAFWTTEPHPPPRCWACRATTTAGKARGRRW